MRTTHQNLVKLACVCQRRSSPWKVCDGCCAFTKFLCASGIPRMETSRDVSMHGDMTHGDMTLLYICLPIRAHRPARVSSLVCGQLPILPATHL